eukprot:1877769-Rhodomonas_salina.3
MHAHEQTQPGAHHGSIQQNEACTTRVCKEQKRTAVHACARNGNGQPFTRACTWDIVRRLAGPGALFSAKSTMTRAESRTSVMSRSVSRFPCTTCAAPTLSVPQYKGRVPQKQYWSHYGLQESRSSGRTTIRCE